MSTTTTLKVDRFSAAVLIAFVSVTIMVVSAVCVTQSGEDDPLVGQHFVTHQYEDGPVKTGHVISRVSASAYLVRFDDVGKQVVEAKAFYGWRFFDSSEELLEFYIPFLAKEPK